MTEITTLCYVENEDSYLMMLRNKKKQDINAGKWIGIGGHLEKDESPEECLLREAMEETGLKLTSYKLRGIITFIYKSICEYMFLYTADKFEGSIAECNEGELSWIKKSEIMDLNLWEGDRIFLKLLTEDAPMFSLKLVYDENDNLIEHSLENY